MAVHQQVLHGTEFLQQFYGRFFSYAGAAGNIIGRITHQSQQVDHLTRMINLIFLHHFFIIQHIKIVAAVFGLVLENMGFR